MAVALATAAKREREAKRENVATDPLANDRRYMSEAELATACIAATYKAKGSRTLSDSEREALAAMVAEKLTREYKATRARDSREVRRMLRYIDRADRMPLLAARSGLVERGESGLNRLTLIVDGFMRDSREWRDVASSYQTRQQQQANTGPMVEPLDALAPGRLAEASRRERESRGTDAAIIERHWGEVAEAVADALAVSVGGDLEREREAVEVAILAGMSKLQAVADERGLSLSLAKKRAARGSTLLRENVRGTDLVELVREVAAPILSRSLDALAIRLARDPATVAAMLCPVESSAIAAAVAAKKAESRYPSHEVDPATSSRRGSARDVLAYVERQLDRLDRWSGDVWREPVERPATYPATLIARYVTRSRMVEPDRESSAVEHVTTYERLPLPGSRVKRSPVEPDKREPVAISCDPLNITQADRDRWHTSLVARAESMYLDAAYSFGWTGQQIPRWAVLAMRESYPTGEPVESESESGAVTD